MSHKYKAVFQRKPGKDDRKSIQGSGFISPNTLSINTYKTRTFPRIHVTSFPICHVCVIITYNYKSVAPNEARQETDTFYFTSSLLSMSWALDFHPLGSLVFDLNSVFLSHCRTKTHETFEPISCKEGVKIGCLVYNQRQVLC